MTPAQAPPHIPVAASPVETPEVQQPTPADPLSIVRQHLASILPTALQGREPWEQEMLKQTFESLSKSKQLTGKLLLATFGKENQYRVLFYDKFLSIRANTQGMAKNLFYSSDIDKPATECNFSSEQKREFYPLIEEFSPQPPANDIPIREATVKESSRIKQDKAQTTPGQSTFRLPLPEDIRTILVIEDLRSLLTFWRSHAGQAYLFPDRHPNHHWKHLHSEWKTYLVKLG